MQQATAQRAGYSIPPGPSATRFKTQAGREIASAGARAAEANKTAAEAGAQVAAANERTKILELEVPKQRERAAKAEKALWWSYRKS